MKRMVVIDCAGAYLGGALQILKSAPDCQIAAVTVSYGITELDESVKKAAVALSAFGSDLPVISGAAQPLMERPKGVQPQPPYAWDEIYRLAKACEGGLTLLMLGPLTNLATALFCYEDLPRYLREVVVCGGSCGAGDVTPFGEQNILFDPKACEAVLRSGVRIVLAGIDALRRSALPPTELSAALAYSEKAASLLGAPPEQSEELAVYQRGMFGAAALLLHEASAATERFVCVETCGGANLGRTIVERRLHAKTPPNAIVLEQIDHDAYLWQLTRSAAGHL